MACLRDHAAVVNGMQGIPHMSVKRRVIAVVKLGVGAAVASVNDQCRFEQAIFMMAHMRCGSTALSNILCGRPEISGYGEAHVTYTSRSSLGALVVNQALRREWSPQAPHLFDKILHSRYDAHAQAQFFQSRAIFVAREPVEAVRSIRNLFARIGRGEYPTDAAAAAYYGERMFRLLSMWDHFPQQNRIGLTHRLLTTDPNGQLERISSFLRLSPPLENRYTSPRASTVGGGGDPLTSRRFSEIVANVDASTIRAKRELEIIPDELYRLNSLYRAFEGKVTASS
jgi:hypothetical protein